MSADVIDLPTAAKAPLPKQRVRGKAPAKVIPGYRLPLQRRLRAGRDKEVQPSQETAAYHRRMDAGLFFMQATSKPPVKVGALIDCLSLTQKLQLLTQRSCEFTLLAISLQQEVSRLQAQLAADTE